MESARTSDRITWSLSENPEILPSTHGSQRGMKMKYRKRARGVSSGALSGEGGGEHVEVPSDP